MPVRRLGSVVSEDGPVSPGAAPVSRMPYVPPEDVAAGVQTYPDSPPVQNAVATVAPQPASSLDALRALWKERATLKAELEAKIKSLEAELDEAEKLLEAIQ